MTGGGEGAVNSIEAGIVVFRFMDQLSNLKPSIVRIGNVLCLARADCD